MGQSTWGGHKICNRLLLFKLRAHLSLRFLLTVTMDIPCLTPEPAPVPGTKCRLRKTRDPITGFRDRIIGAELAETSEIKAIELEVKQSVDADVKKAKTDGEIGEEELYYDIYENNLGGKVRGIFSKDAHEHKKTQQAINV